MSKRRWFAPLIGVAALACVAGTDPAGCDICTTGAIVFGQVRMASGSAVAGARVTVDARTGSCASGTAGSIGAATTSDALGRYRVLVISPSAPAAACLIVAAIPSVTTGAAVTADTGHVVRMQATWPSDATLDSIRVDIALRSLP